MTNNKFEFNELEIENEIYKMTQEMNCIQTSALPFSRGDYITVFVAGLLGGLIDITLGKPGGYKEPKIKNNSYFGLGKKLKEFDLKNNPIDKHIPGASSGDHRLYSYGHDLFQFSKAIKLIMNGHGDVGINSTGGILNLASTPEGFKTPDTLEKALMVYLLHIYKDFWTARSLSIPGSTWIANLNGDKMPEVLEKLTNKYEINLRQLSGQTLSISIIEITIKVWMFFNYYNENISKELIDHKLQQMRLMSHSVALMFNLGKVVVSQNPFFLNLPQILRIVQLATQVALKESDFNNARKEKINLGIIKNQYLGVQTLLLLDETMYMAEKLDKFILISSEKNRILCIESDKKLESEIKQMEKLLSDHKKI